jgi:hypothetical protein
MRASKSNQVHLHPRYGPALSAPAPCSQYGVSSRLMVSAKALLASMALRRARESFMFALVCLDVGGGVAVVDMWK